MVVFLLFLFSFILLLSLLISHSSDSQPCFRKERCVNGYINLLILSWASMLILFILKGLKIKNYAFNPNAVNTIVLKKKMPV